MAICGVSPTSVEAAAGRQAHPPPCLARGRLIAAYSRRERFQTVPYKGFRGPPQTGFRNAQLASGPF